jgi:hypothetical protein
MLGRGVAYRDLLELLENAKTDWIPTLVLGRVEDIVVLFDYKALLGKILGDTEDLETGDVLDFETWCALDAISLFRHSLSST